MVPTAVVIYIIGVFCVGIAELGLSRFAVFDEPKPNVHPGRFSRSGPGLLQQVYADHLRNHELLKGAAVSFVILAVGSLAEWRTLPGFEIVVVLATVGAIFVGVPVVGVCTACPFEQAAALAAVAQNQTPPDQQIAPASSGE